MAHPRAEIGNGERIVNDLVDIAGRPRRAELTQVRIIGFLGDLE